jgi:hypothetical protein
MVLCGCGPDIEIVEIDRQDGAVGEAPQLTSTLMQRDDLESVRPRSGEVGCDLDSGSGAQVRDRRALLWFHQTHLESIGYKTIQSLEAAVVAHLDEISTQTGELLRKTYALASLSVLAIS